jgi:hypothetical protein
LKSGDLTLSLDQARRLAVRSQHLAGPRTGPGPAAEELPDAEAVTSAAEHSMRALGVARARDVERHFTMGRYPGLDLERAGWARPVRVEGGTE